MRFGFHISISGGFRLVPERARSVKCETLQLFTRNPRGWSEKHLDDEDVAQFRADMKTSGISPAFAHAPYLPNLAAADYALSGRSIALLSDEMRRCEKLGIGFLIVHVGRAGGQEEPAALAKVADSVNRIHSAAPGRVRLLLENTAGMGSEVGCRFEQLARVFERVDDRDRLGVVLDTAHAFEAGYDLRNGEGVDRTLRELDGAIGLGSLHLLHLNDSKTDFGSRVDRHWHIGRGKIGRGGFRAVVNHPLLANLPGIMETPRRGPADDLRNLTTIRGLAN